MHPAVFVGMYMQYAYGVDTEFDISAKLGEIKIQNITLAVIFFSSVTVVVLFKLKLSLLLFF